MSEFQQPSSSSLPRPPEPRPPKTQPSKTQPSAGHRLVLCPEHRRRLSALAEISYPFEACGVLAGEEEGGEIRIREVFSARNVSERLRDRFRLDPEDFLAADRQARQRGLEIVGIWHSHPNRQALPSPLDRDEAWNGYSYLILGVDPRGRVDFRSWRLGEDAGPGMGNGGAGNGGAGNGGAGNGGAEKMVEEEIAWRPETRRPETRRPETRRPETERDDLGDAIEAALASSPLEAAQGGAR